MGASNLQPRRSALPEWRANCNEYSRTSVSKLPLPMGEGWGEGALNVARLLVEFTDGWLGRRLGDAPDQPNVEIRRPARHSRAEPAPAKAWGGNPATAAT